MEIRFRTDPLNFQGRVPEGTMGFSPLNFRFLREYLGRELSSLSSRLEHIWDRLINCAFLLGTCISLRIFISRTTFIPELHKVLKK